MNATRATAVVLGIIAAIALFVLIVGLTSTGTIIVWRLILFIVIFLGALAGAGILWRRGARPRGAAD